MARFEENLNESETVYQRCLTNFIDSLALYPQNKKLADLKNKYKQFFQLFGESSPVTKSLSNSCANQWPKKSREVKSDDIAPSFSLGKQMTGVTLGCYRSLSKEDPEEISCQRLSVGRRT